ncbi:Caspase-1 [Orchesella cincta]|uniref:Caspase-1 n=1 Tax=Orchesella cincta TaxID=48709 RepID=A0A1D2NKR8_ORCCI|nr:Caspase-1 [Orchesella cincta]
MESEKQIEQREEEQTTETTAGKRDETDAKSWTQSLVDSLPSKGNTAIMPVERDSEVYNMRHPKRGKAVIFNHMKFENGQSTRNGTETDEQKLKNCLLSLGFEVIVHRDLKRLEIMDVIYELRKEDHSESDCLMIVVLSHGEKNKIYCSDSDYKPEMLWDAFTADVCPTLAGKPKIFWIQACRGDQLDAGTKLRSRTQTDSLPQKDSMNYVVPNRADFLIVYSTVEGYYSWRNTIEGSWFVQSLTKVISNYKNKKDLLSMMTIVCREVALNFESNVPNNSSFDQKKQIPMINSTLIRDIYL